MQGGVEQRALLIAGPTCSGKSALALDLAARLGGTIVNADSMQIYRDLRVLTARPTPEEEARLPHCLYGVLPAAEAGSVACWRQTALATMAEIRASGRLPILCGGTGLYFASLTTGLVDIPDPGAEARAEARGLLAELGPATLHARLAVHDPETAARLRPGDSQRIARAWEVWRGTGQGMAAWQLQPAEPAPWRFAAVLLDPPRAGLREAIAARFDAMLGQDALDEVRGLLAQGLDPALPAMRAHGVPELSAYLQGTITLEEAARRAIAATGRYTKRQATWFRHHALTLNGPQTKINARYDGSQQFSEKDMAGLLNFIRGFD